MNEQDENKVGEESGRRRCKRFIKRQSLPYSMKTALDVRCMINRFQFQTHFRYDPKETFTTLISRTGEENQMSFYSRQSNQRTQPAPLTVQPGEDAPIPGDIEQHQDRPCRQPS